MEEKKVFVSDHCYKRYVERVKNNSYELNEEKIRDEIRKLFNSSKEYYKGIIGHSNNVVRVFCNKNGWTFIVSEDGNVLITLYKVDLNVDSTELNQMYVDKALEKIEAIKANYEASIVKAKEEQTAYTSEVKQIDDKIKEYKKLIRELEERKDGLFKVSSNSFVDSNAINIELRNALEDFMVRDKFKLFDNLEENKKR